VGSGGEPDWYVARPAHLTANPCDGGGVHQLELRDDGQELLDRDLHLHAREVGTEAAVDAGTECDVRVHGAVDHILVGTILEYRPLCLESSRVQRAKRAGGANRSLRDLRLIK